MSIGQRARSAFAASGGVRCGCLCLRKLATRCSPTSRMPARWWMSGGFCLRLGGTVCPLRSSNVVSTIVRSALRRAGITDAPSQGAHLLRHLAATAMLRAGATLDAIGAVLRHQSPDTTAHYAKVDLATLCLIAQPWPGDA